MDFSELMKQEIEKGKPAANKPMRRAEILAQRNAAYEAEEAARAAKREAKAAAKRKAEEEAADEARARKEKRARLGEESRRRREEEELEAERRRRKRLGLPEIPVQTGEEEEKLEEWEDVPEEELRERLREIGEPVLVFGEGHVARVKRYRKLTTVVTQGPIPTTLRLVEEKDMKVDEEIPKDRKGREWLFRQLGSYFTMVLTEYEKAMEREKRETATSRNAYRNMVECRENMKPLFRKLEKGDLPDSILGPVVEIVKAAQERRYVDANDGYLTLCIGKAAWPIGVTMVGIHERSAREKLHNGERGHVMGDEITRKYLQSIKRCITFAQVRWPPTDVRQLMG